MQFPAGGTVFWGVQVLCVLQYLVPLPVGAATQKPEQQSPLTEQGALVARHDPAASAGVTVADTTSGAVTAATPAPARRPSAWRRESPAGFKAAWSRPFSASSSS